MKIIVYYKNIKSYHSVLNKNSFFKIFYKIYSKEDNLYLYNKQ